MTILILLLSLPFVYFLLLLIVPKGNLLREFLELGQYWYRIFFLPSAHYHVSRFKYGPHRRQYFLLYQNTAQQEPNRPLILYYHGGAWGVGSPESFKSNAQVFLDQGYDVVMPSYRRIPFYNFRHIREDITLTMKKLYEVCQGLGYQHKKIILGGMSAGGHLAALILYDRQHLDQTGFKPSDFVGLFLLGAPLQLHSMSKTPVLWFLAGSRKGALFAQANPINFLKGQEKTPVLIIHGKKDGIVAYRAAADFYQKLNQLSPETVIFKILEKGGHLDVAKWVYIKEGPQSWLLDWLDTLNK